MVHECATDIFVKYLLSSSLILLLWTLANSLRLTVYSERILHDGGQNRGAISVWLFVFHLLQFLLHLTSVLSHHAEGTVFKHNVILLEDSLHVTFLQRLRQKISDFVTLSQLLLLILFQILMHQDDEWLVDVFVFAYFVLFCLFLFLDQKLGLLIRVVNLSQTLLC